MYTTPVEDEESTLLFALASVFGVFGFGLIVWALWRSCCGPRTYYYNYEEKSFNRSGGLHWPSLKKWMTMPRIAMPTITIPKTLSPSASRQRVSFQKFVTVHSVSMPSHEGGDNGGEDPTDSSSSDEDEEPVYLSETFGPNGVSERFRDDLYLHHFAAGDTSTDTPTVRQRSDNESGENSSDAATMMLNIV